MIIKKGASIKGLRPEVLVGLMIADQIYNEIGNQELVVTEGTGGKHGRGSLHYVGLAVDLRTRYFDVLTLQAVERHLKAKLNEEFDVVVEETHIHLEFQPK